MNIGDIYDLSSPGVDIYFKKDDNKKERTTENKVKNQKVLVTGGMGFIGSNFIRYALKQHGDWEITNLDKLTYAGNPRNLLDVIYNPAYGFVLGDISDAAFVDKLFSEHFDTIVNFAAESHVDRSLEDASPFIKTNIGGVQVLLDAVKKYGVGRFIQVSTDEVYGALGKEGLFREDSPISPNSPYAASKAAGDLLCHAYYVSYNLPVIVTHCSNNYGPYQFPEKLIPMVITNAIKDKEIPIYGDGLNIRDWIHVRDHCRAIDMVIGKGKAGEVYNIGANSEKTNLEIVRKILNYMGKSESLIRFVKDRLGHDRRYAIDSTKITRELGYHPSVTFEKGIESTVDWYLQNRDWWSNQV